jgi:hypothetical protein
MAFQMGFSKDELQGKPPVPAGWYILQLKGFKPKASKPKPPSTESESWNMNAEFEIINHPEHSTRKVFAGFNSKIPWAIVDFVHATGLRMEEVQNGDEGTEKALFVIPGVWENIDKFPDDPSKWNYLGPLVNRTVEVELAEIPATGQYKAKNEIRQFKCAVQGCVDKHSTNLIFNKTE